MHHPTDRIIHTTAFVTPVVEHWLEREIAQWVHPMKDRSDDPSHNERTLLPLCRGYTFKVASRSGFLLVVVGGGGGFGGLFLVILFARYRSCVPLHYQCTSIGRYNTYGFQN